MKKVSVIITILTIGLMVLSGCASKEPIPIGLCITITDADGYPLQHGITIRNGFEMAVDEINNSGGINGRPLEPIIMDDQDSLDQAKACLDQLHEKDVHYVVGFATSKMMPAIEYAAEKYDMLFISPSMSSTLFEGIDDRFLRVYESDSMEVKLMTELVTERLKLNRIAVVYDYENANYTEPYYENFKTGIGKKGYSLAYEESYTDPQVMIGHIASKLQEVEADGILIISDSGDVIDLAQELCRNDMDIDIMVSGWAMTVDLPMLGGRTVENVYGIRGYKEDLDLPTFKAFKDVYANYYDEELTQFSITGYMAVKLFEHGLLNAGPDHVEAVKAEIINQGTFKGILGDVVMDAYGDIESQKYVLTIKDGLYVEVE